MNTDGSQLRQVTYLPDGACQPAWSPDGSQIVFTSPCPKRQDDYPAAKLYVTNVDGNGLVELPSEGDGDFDPAWSPDGTRIAFTSLQSGRDQIYVLNLNDYGMMPLTDMSGDVHLLDWSRQPAWSPDGTQIVYTGHSRLTTTLQIWIMDEAGLTKTLLIPRGSEYWDFLPTWSSDGKTILFNETSGPQALGWLMTFDYEHRETAQATHLRAGTFANYGRYSPDGLWVVYDNIDITDPNSMDYDIYILRTAPGNAPIRLASDPAMDFDPAWQPAGSP